jgi:hypothetical protein|tara:strand:- start:1429 stop:2271 length:843 start_codon:yes stop_codon:yes gene_type:complete
MSFIFGGGGGGGGQTQSGSSVVTQREAPGVEARKLSLYDQAAKLASTPVSLPAVQVAPLSGLEQAGIAQAGQVGVGAGTVGQGITALQGAQAAPNISSFLNPYQSYVTDEITRQAGIATNRLGAQAVASGAFGGGRQGIAEAEIERARLANIGQAQAQGFQTALGAAQTQRQQQLAAGATLGSLGAQQQAMSLADIQSQLQAGGVQRGIGQAGLEAQRQTALQRQYEPYQRIEFLKGIMTNLPTTQSTLTATTAPGANPVGQALGAGLGAYSAYNLMQPR